MTTARVFLCSVSLLASSSLSACSSDETPEPKGQTEEPSSDDDDDDAPRDAGKPKDAGKPSSPLDAGTAALRDAGKPTGPVNSADAGSGSGTDSGTGVDAGADPGEVSAFPAVTDPTKDGPYKSKTVNNAGPNSNYTIYQPDPLGPDGLKHPVLTWGNGGSTSPSWYSMLPHLATHGFVVVAANTVPSIGAEEALGKDMTMGMDWMLEQNVKEGSEYFGKLDMVNVAPFGYSMGGLATWTIVSDPRWITTVHLSGGNTMDGPARVAKAIKPMFWECGTGDIAGPQCDDDFKSVTTQSVFYGTLQGVDHLGILESGPDAKISGAVTAWFRYYLMHDQSYKTWFLGDDCGLCKNTTDWKVQKKNYE